MTTPDITGLFHPLVDRWFRDVFNAPTVAQQMAWPSIAAGENVLVIAPTGSGKTLTAFLSAIDRLVKNRWKTGTTRVLYVSPLRALNNDILRNLKVPLEGIGEVFAAAGQEMPVIRTATRSGDSSPAERREMFRRPPEILITTPESLNILLTSKSGRGMLGNIQTVILDEVHAVAGSKRGTHLITAVERLARLSGEFQRIALSATVRPAEHVAEWLGGFRIQRRGDHVAYEPRPIRVLDTLEKKNFSLSVHFKTEAATPLPNEIEGENPVWHAVAEEVSHCIDRNTSTLVFGNSRRAVEKMARLVNRDCEQKKVWAHHGSLSREIREVVEERLKQGQLSGIVATNSLELGIDVGAIDEVVMVESPPSIASTVQRIGRSGHGVGETSRGRIYAVHSRDLINAAINVEGLRAGEIEPIAIPENPLDVLAQVLLSMTAVEPWSLSALLDFVRTMAPYRNLSARQFGLVIDMLAGKYAGVRIRALKPRVRVNRVAKTIEGRPGNDRLIYAAGGTIPDRGYFTLRVSENGAAIGQLDEEFVWERSIGDTFTLGVQTWRIQGISHNDVFVVPGGGGRAETPFWTSEERSSKYWFARRKGEFLKQADRALEKSSYKNLLQTEYFFADDAAEELIRFLKSQKKHTGCDLPHSHHLVVEHVSYPPGTGPENVSVIHTTWGGRVNRPLAVALAQAIEESTGKSVPYIIDEDCIALELPEPLGAREIFRQIQPEEIEQLIRRRLETSGFFGAHFREAAERSLLLPKAGFKKRTPLWLSRKRAKELKEAVSVYADFPILLETWRTCLQDEMDVSRLLYLLDEVASGNISLDEVTTAEPSPMAREVIWKRTNEVMYEGDASGTEKSAMREDLIAEVVRSSELRPSISRDIVSLLDAKLKRTHAGYSPRDPAELLDWIEERILVPEKEWWQLLEAMERDHEIQKENAIEALGDRVVGILLRVDGETRTQRFVCAVEQAHRAGRALSPQQSVEYVSLRLDGARASADSMNAIETLTRSESDAPRHDDDQEEFSSFLADWLRFYGPIPVWEVKKILGVSQKVLDRALLQLREDSRVVIDSITADTSEVEICDGDNLARLIRWNRLASRTAFEPLTCEFLPLFLALQHELGHAGDEDQLKLTLERLFGYEADPHLWEEEILPARLDSYRRSWIDNLFSESNLVWLGSKKHKISFALETDRDLFIGSRRVNPADKARLSRVFPEGPGRYTVSDLMLRAEGLGPSELVNELWSFAWNGLVSNDSFAAVRQGVRSDFQTTERSDQGAHGPRRRHFSRWKSEHSIAGNWFVLPEQQKPRDSLEEEEQKQERVRVLVARYGIVYRDLLKREAPALSWATLFRTLRILELSGEVIGGCFFRDLQSLQFISPRALAGLRNGLPDNFIYWLNATDPISPCGLGLPGHQLPRRVPTNHIVFRGKDLVITSRSRCKNLEIRLNPDDPDLSECLRFVRVLLNRDVRPARAIVIETINGKPAATSPYLEAFRNISDIDKDHKSVRLTRRY